MILVVFFALWLSALGYAGRIRWSRFVNFGTMAFDVAEEPFEKYFSAAFGLAIGAGIGLAAFYPVLWIMPACKTLVECVIAGAAISWVHPWFRTFDHYVGGSFPRRGDAAYGKFVHRAISALCGGAVGAFVGQALWVSSKFFR